MKPLSLILIEQIFSFMEVCRFTTYEIELEGAQWPILQTLVSNFKHPEIVYPIDVDFIFGAKSIEFKKDGMTLTFIEKK